MYGSNAVELFFVNTNAQLEVRGYKEMSGNSKAIKFQGIMRSRFAFSDWDKLWSNKSENKFIDPPNFGKKTGMFHDHFKQIFICQRYSRQPPEQPEGVPWSNINGCLLMIMFWLSTSIVPKLSLRPERLLSTKVYLVGMVRYWRRLDQR